MTPDELRTILQRLAGYCAAIEEDLHDTAYPAAASSNAGAAPIGPKGKPPCSIVDLDYIVEDVSPIIRGWCTALQKDGHRTGLPMGQPLNVWVAWLSRHRATLLAMPWATDAVEELVTLTRQLGERLHPRSTDEKLQGLPAFATAVELSAHLDISEKSIKRWAGRQGIEHWTNPDGANIYPTAVVLERRQTP